VCSGNAWLLSKKGYQAKLRPDMVYSATQVSQSTSHIDKRASLSVAIPSCLCVCVYDFDKVLRVVEEEAKSKGTQVVDARGAPRFNAQVDEPRPGLGNTHSWRDVCLYLYMCLRLCVCLCVLCQRVVVSPGLGMCPLTSCCKMTGPNSEAPRYYPHRERVWHSSKRPA
jgi:hypothetical protein